MFYRLPNSFQAGLNQISNKKYFLSYLLEKKKGSELNFFLRNKSYTNPTGIPGSGAGKGGGAGGSIRESGGSLGQYGTAQEEQFFFNKQREQLEKLKKKLKESKVGDLTQKKEKWGFFNLNWLINK